MTPARTWYEFKALAEGEAELAIYDEIGGWGVSASALIAELKRYAGKALTVRINSPGGSVTEGVAIFNALRRHDASVTTCIDGMAASMASYVALAGASVKMAANAFMMIHNPSGGAIGSSEDLRKAADLVDKMKATLVDGYAGKSGKDKETISDAMNAETWFNAAEALDYGLIDEITDGVKVSAHFDLSKFRNAARVVDTRLPDMSDLAELTAKLEIAQGQAQKNFTDYQAATKERDELKAKLEEEKGVSAEMAKSLNEAKTKLDAHASELTEAKKVTAEAINAKANEILSTHGHAPLKFKSGGVTENTMSRADFGQLGAKAQSEFCRNGGRITE